MIDLIENVVEKLKEKYPNAYFSYEYHKEDDIYEIWYNQKELSNNFEFENFVGELMISECYKKGFTNFFIDYNEEKAINLEYFSENDYLEVEDTKYDQYLINNKNLSNDNAYFLAA